MSYHIDLIPKGIYGESSKIIEEVLELQDAEKQGVQVMVLNELADIIGAVEGYLHQNFTGFTLDDLIKMKEVTSRAFASGHRSAS